MNKYIYIILAIGIVCLGLSLLKINSVPVEQIQNLKPEVVYVNATKNDIVVSSPVLQSVVSSPMRISGEARGTWYFEASFPIVLLDSNGNQIAIGHAEAQGEWMTENFVPFVATLPFSSPTTRDGVLVLKNDNPSGDPIRDKEVRIPVLFGM